MNSVSPPWIWRSSSDEHEVFHLPDRCSNPEKPLAATATSVTLPANLLQPNRTYGVNLAFIRGSGMVTHDSPRFTVLGGYSRATEFEIRTTDGNPITAPVVTGYRVTVDGYFEVDATASAGMTVILEATGDFGSWTDAGSAVVPPIGSVTLRDLRPAAFEFQAYRLRVQ